MSDTESVNDDDDLSTRSSQAESDSDDSTKSEATVSTWTNTGSTSVAGSSRLLRAATLSAFGELHHTQYSEFKVASKLMDYIRRGDIRYVRRILSRHRPIAAVICVRPIKTAGGWSAMTSAADFGYTEIVRLMANDYGADVTCLDDNGWSPLHAAASKCHGSVIRTLIESRVSCNIDLRSRDKWTSLHIGVRKIKTITPAETMMPPVTLFRQLRGCHPHLTQSSPLNVRWNTPRLRELQFAQYVFSHRDQMVGLMPKSYELAKGAATAVEVLLQHGADANATGPCGWTALHLAALVGRRDLVAMLVQYGAQAGAMIDVSSSTPVHVAAQKGYAAAIEQLVNGMTPDEINPLLQKVNVDGWTALHMAAAIGSLDVVKILVEHGSPEALNRCNKHGCTPLYLAVQNGHANVAQYFIQKVGKGVNQSANQWSPLGVAVDRADAKTVNVFITGANKTAEKKESCSSYSLNFAVESSDDEIPPLHVALFNRNLELVRRLVAGGADVNRLYDGVTACHLAATVDVSRSAFVDALLPTTGQTVRSCDVNAGDANMDRTPLHYAAVCGNHRAVKSLIDVPGVDINASDTAGWTPLHVAAHQGSSEVVRLLLKAGCDVNRSTSTGYTSLHLAVKEGHIEIIGFLINYKADVNATATSENLQPIHLAALNSNEHVIEMLINAGADVTAVATETGRTCLHLAALSGNQPVVVHLLAKHRSRCDVNATSSGGWTPLHLACQTGKSETVAELLKHGADDSLKLDNDGETALYVAAAHGRREIVELMLKRTTVCRRTTSRAGWSELHAAAAHGHADIVETLVMFPTGSGGSSGGKQPNDVDARSLATGETALQVAARAGHVKVVGMLIAAGAKCDVRCAVGLSPLYVAAASGHVGVVRLLLEHGTVDVNGLNGRLLRTALHVAGNASTAKALIDGGARVNIRDGPGRTPMKLAAHEGRTDVVQLLQLLQAQQESNEHKDEDD